MSSTSVLTFSPAGDCLTTNSLLQLYCLQHLGMDSTENTVPLSLFQIVAVQTCLSAKPLFNNGCCIYAYLAVVTSNGSTCHNMKLFERKHFGNWLTRYRWSLNELYTFSYHKYYTYYIVYITHSPSSEMDSCTTSGLNAGQYSII
jgi:hypothetical protein